MATSCASALKVSTCAFGFGVLITQFIFYTMEVSIINHYTLMGFGAGFINLPLLFVQKNEDNGTSTWWCWIRSNGWLIILIGSHQLYKYYNEPYEVIFFVILVFITFCMTLLHFIFVAYCNNFKKDKSLPYIENNA